MLDTLPDPIALTVVEAMDLAIRVGILVLIVWMIRSKDRTLKSLAVACCLFLTGCGTLGYGFIDLEMKPIGVHLQMHAEDADLSKPSPDPNAADAAESDD